ncbi:MAG: pyridoxal-phosphate dependent enzyme [Alphaproteobacteria bacterium]|nr:pyridoxal-phosphate dependent enzyme [Alphaproteobacteria bacterium]
MLPAMNDPSLKARLITEILRARSRVYHVGQRTPLEPMRINGEDFHLFVKREDLSPINAYKWRGAYNCIKILSDEGEAGPFVAASAGNHAQGVALAARKLGLPAKIFMPLSTPRMKQQSVERLGGAMIEVVLEGDDYNVAGAAAKAYAKEHGHTYIHPFDDLRTIAGQATIADEIVLSGEGPFDYAFLQIGGGGMAAGVAVWLKEHYPAIKIVGVEEADQACMKAAIEAGEPVTLDKVDTFCDGTAVTRAGDLTFALCRETLDTIVTVSNEETCAAIQRFWESKRVIPEASGALGLAGVLHYAERYPEELCGKRVLTVVSGANADFGKIPLFVANSAVGANRKRFYRFHINEKGGSLLGILDTVFADVSVHEFQYGKISAKDAWPIVALEARPDKLEALHDSMKAHGIDFEDVTSAPDVRFRIINYNPALFHDPLIMHVHFPERRGALRDLLRKISDVANICYFNYQYSGESIGRALMGFEFDSPEKRATFLDIIRNSVVTARPVEPETAKRILAYSREDLSSGSWCK